jgi:anti-repressor protein
VNDLDLFANAGDGLSPEHFGIDEHGRAYVQASAFAKAMGYRDAANALRILDEDERGTHLVSTPGGQQRASVIYEDGIWELIFRSTRPSARSIKARVKSILRQLRETGVVDTRESPELPADYETALEHLLASVRERKQLEARNAELEPAARSWRHLADASGDYSLREAAQILDRDPAIRTGQNRLSKWLKNFGWTDQRGTPYQRHVEAGRLLLRTYTDRQDVARTQIRITVKGLHDLHREMGGSGPLLLEVAG